MIKFSIFLIMLISLLVCRAFFLLAIVLLIAICTMLIGIHFHEYYYPMNHFQTLAYLEIFYYVLPSLYSLKKCTERLLFLNILFNTLAHLPTPFPSPMSIDEYFEITLKVILVPFSFKVKVFKNCIHCGNFLLVSGRKM